MLLTDRTQVLLVRLGAVSLLLLIFRHLAENDISSSRLITFFDVSLLLSNPSLVLNTMVGFVFAQLLYYDNWQRLSFFYNSQSKLTDELVGEVTTRLQRKLVGVAFMLVVLYMCPVLLGAAQTLGGATQGSYGLLVAFLQDAYSSSRCGLYQLCWYSFFLLAH